MGHAFWKENIEDRVKLLQSIVLNCCVKVKVGRFVQNRNNISENLAHKFPSKGGARKVHHWCIFFALPAMNGALTAELTFRETQLIRRNCVTSDVS